MTCQIYQEELSVYVDGELHAARAARLEAHLRVCPHCRRELDALSSVSGLVRAGSRGLQVSHDFDQRVLRAVGNVQVTTRRTQPRFLLRPLFVLALILLALLGIIKHFFYQPLAPPVPAPAPAAAVSAPARLLAQSPILELIRSA